MSDSRRPPGAGSVRPEGTALADCLADLESIGYGTLDPEDVVRGKGQPATPGEHAFQTFVREAVFARLARQYSPHAPSDADSPDTGSPEVPDSRNESETFSAMATVFEIAHQIIDDYDATCFMLKGMAFADKATVNNTTDWHTIRRTLRDLQAAARSRTSMDESPVMQDGREKEIARAFMDIARSEIPASADAIEGDRLIAKAALSLGDRFREIGYDVRPPQRGVGRF